MKKIGTIFRSIFMILIGAAAVGAYFVLRRNGGDVDRYAVALALGIGFLGSGVIELFGRKKRE